MRYTAIILLIAAAGFAASMMALHPRQKTSVPTTATVLMGGATVSVEIASSSEEEQRGLSGRASLPDDTGMLFVFDQDSYWGFWMKDMNFPIDIIWTDATGTVTTIEPSLSPDTYPDAFYPKSPSRFVLEVPAGFAAAHGVVEGSKVTLPQDLSAL